MKNITGTTINDLHDDIDNIIEIGRKGDSDKAKHLINLLHQRLIKELDEIQSNDS